MSLKKRTDPVLVRNWKSNASLRPGDVVTFGNHAEIASARAENGEYVGLDFFGGEYDGIADGAMSIGDDVYYNAATGKLTKTVVGCPHIGYVSYAPDNCQDGSTVCVLHAPKGVSLVATATPPVATNVASLTDSTGGTVSVEDSLVAPAATDYTAAELKANFATLAAKIDAVLTSIKTAGFMVADEEATVA